MNESHDSECYHHAALTISVNIGSFPNAQFFEHQRLKSVRDEKNMIHNIGFIRQILEVLLMTSSELHHHL